MVLECQYKHQTGVKSEVKKMKLNREKINICMARKQMTVQQLAEAYGVSRARMNVILNQRTVSVVSAGRMAAALGCDIEEIIEQ